MPIKKNADGVIEYTDKSERFETETTGVHPADSFFVCDNIDQLKQLGFNLENLAPNSRVIFKVANPTPDSEIVITFPGRDIELGAAQRIVVEKTASETVSAWKLVYMTSPETVAVANPYNEAKVDVLGLALNAGMTGEKIQVLTMGEATDPFFNFPLNKTLYLGMNGDLTDVVPQTGFLVEVGSSSGGNSVFIRVDRIIQL